MAKAKAQPRPSIIPWLIGAAIAAAATWAFLPAIRGTWIWDDDQYVTQNLDLRTAGGLVRIWFDPRGVNYFPITDTLRWVQWHLWSLAPLGYHVTNLVLHICSALLFWRFLGKIGLRSAWIGGLIFALHPLTVESVAWISELKNALALPPLLLAMSAYVDFDARSHLGNPESGRALFASLGWFTAAMLCKTSAAMFPLVILLFCWWRRGRVSGSDVKSSAGFFVVSIVFGVLTIGFERLRSIGDLAVPLEGVVNRIGGAALAAAFYAWKCIWPVSLSPIYPRWSVSPLSAPQWLAWVAWILLFAWFWIKRSTWGRHAILGMGFFLMNLAPVLGIVPMAYLRLSWVADHFAYISVLGLIGLAVGIANSLETALPKTLQSKLIPSALALVAIPLAFITHSYSGVFDSPETLWTETLRHYPGSWSAHNDLGSVRYEHGRLQDAIAEFSEAVRLNPSYAEAHNNLGVALASAKRCPEAIAHYRTAIAIRKNYAVAFCNLGNALLQIGDANSAVSEYEQAMKIRPDFPEAHYNLALALKALGRIAESQQQFRLSGLLK